MGVQRVSAASGLASAGSTWVGGVAPVDGDFIKVMEGHTVTQDVNRIYGDLVQTTYDAVDIRGTSAASYGEFIVNDGVTLTLRGTNNDGTGPAYNIHIRQWGKFSPQPGCALILDCPGDGLGVVSSEGIINAIGTAAKRITWDIPAANKNWNNAHALNYTPPNGPAYIPYDDAVGIGCAYLGATCLSNAAGTGIGTPADSSVSFSAQVPAGILTTPVASIAAVNSVGKYFVDHEGGFVFFFTAQAWGSNISFTVNAKKLTIKSVKIRSRLNWDGHQAVFRYNDLTCIGTVSGGAIEAAYKTNAAGVTRRFEVTHCRFKYGYGVVMDNDVIGVAGDPIVVSDNEYTGILPNNYNAANVISVGTFPYLKMERNKHHLSPCDFLNDYFSLGAPNAVIQDNVTWTNTMIEKPNRSVQWVGALLNGNAMLGRGGLSDSRLLTSLHGTAASRTVISNNLVHRAQRAWNYGEWNDLLDNVILHTFHHTIMAQDAIGQGWTPNVRIKRNLIAYTSDNGAAQVGYNYDSVQEDPEVEHNTLYKNSQAVGFGDQSDSTGMQMQLRYILRSNLIEQAGIAVNRPADAALIGSRTHIAAADHNNIHGSTTADFAGIFTRFCTPSGLANITGVSLHSPSFAAPVSGKTLALVVGSSTSRTLSWDGGAAVQLYRESGQVTSAEANSAWPDLGYLNDSAKAWPVLQYNNAASVVGAWVVITAGTGAGQVRRILNNNTGSRLIVAKGWTTPLDATSQYQIWRSEVVLSNAGATQTISAGIDFPNFPATSQTDAAVAISFNGKALDPQFADATRSLATWDASLGGTGTEDGAIARLYADPTLTRSALLPYLKAGFTPTNAALATAAHDGTTIGAMEYVPTTHLAWAIEPGGAVSGRLLSPQPRVQRLKDLDNSLSTDARLITLALVTIEGGPGELFGTKSGPGPDFAPTDLYVVGEGTYELSAE